MYHIILAQAFKDTMKEDKMKKTLALILVMTMLIPGITPASFAGNNSKLTDFINNDLPTLIKSLESVNGSSTSMLSSSYHLSTPEYSYSSDGYEIIEYPLYQNGILTGIYSIIVDNGQYYSNLSTDVESYDFAIKTSGKVSTAHIIDVQEQPAYGLMSLFRGASLSRSNGTKLSVPIQRQGSYGYCWACCITSMIYYIDGISKSPGQICDDMGVEYKNGANGGANLIKAEAAFQKYGFTTQMGGVMTESQIVKVIDSDLPVFTQWFSDKPDRDGHSMVLAGYRYSSSGFGMTLMDPNRGFIASRYRGKKIKNYIQRKW